MTGSSIVARNKRICAILSSRGMGMIICTGHSIVRRVGSSSVITATSVGRVSSEAKLVPVSMSVPGCDKSCRSTRTTPEGVRVGARPANGAMFALAIDAAKARHSNCRVKRVGIGPRGVAVAKTRSAMGSVSGTMTGVGMSKVSGSRRVATRLILCSTSKGMVGRKRLDGGLKRSKVAMSIAMVEVGAIPLGFRTSKAPTSKCRCLNYSDRPTDIRVYKGRRTLSGVRDVGVPTSRLSVTKTARGVRGTFSVASCLPRNMRLVRNTSKGIATATVVRRLKGHAVRFVITSVGRGCLTGGLRMDCRPSTRIALMFRKRGSALSDLSVDGTMSMGLRGCAGRNACSVPMRMSLPSKMALAGPIAIRLVLARGKSAGSRRPRGSTKAGWWCFVLVGGMRIWVGGRLEELTLAIFGTCCVVLRLGLPAVERVR